MQSSQPGPGFNHLAILDPSQALRELNEHPEQLRQATHDAASSLARYAARSSKDAYFLADGLRTLLRQPRADVRLSTRSVAGILALLPKEVLLGVPFSTDERAQLLIAIDNLTRFSRELENTEPLLVLRAALTAEAS